MSAHLILPLICFIWSLGGCGGSARRGGRFYGEWVVRSNTAYVPMTFLGLCNQSQAEAVL